jgi:hypothetical protein
MKMVWKSALVVSSVQAYAQLTVSMYEARTIHLMLLSPRENVMGMCTR